MLDNELDWSWTRNGIEIGMECSILRNGPLFIPLGNLSLCRTFPFPFLSFAPDWVGSMPIWIGPCFAYFPLQIVSCPYWLGPPIRFGAMPFLSIAIAIHSFFDQNAGLILLVGNCFTPGAGPFCLTLVFVWGRVVRCRYGWIA